MRTSWTLTHPETGHSFATSDGYRKVRALQLGYEVEGSGEEPDPTFDLSGPGDLVAGVSNRRPRKAVAKKSSASKSAPADDEEQD